jgi:hypothetical protein
MGKTRETREIREMGGWGDEFFPSAQCPMPND